MNLDEMNLCTFMSRGIEIAALRMRAVPQVNDDVIIKNKRYIVLDRQFFIDEDGISTFPRIEIQVGVRG